MGAPSAQPNRMFGAMVNVAQLLGKGQGLGGGQVWSFCESSLALLLIPSFYDLIYHCFKGCF